MDATRLHALDHDLQRLAQHRENLIDFDIHVEDARHDLRRALNELHVAVDRYRVAVEERNLAAIALADLVQQVGDRLP